MGALSNRHEIQKAKEDFDNKRSEEVRQKVIQYRALFLSGPGWDILTELCNKYHFLSERQLTDFEQGERAVLTAIFKAAHVDVTELSKKLRGEL